MQKARHGNWGEKAKHDRLPEPTTFADSITADHMILASDDASRNGSIVSLVVFDRFTQWLQAYADKYKDGGACE